MRAYTDAEIEDAAWQLAERDGFRYGRCGIFESYVTQVKQTLELLEIAKNREDD